MTYKGENFMEMPLITGHTKLTALLGSPVAHSISPLMHNEGFRQLGLDYVYLCFEINEETLPAAVIGLKTAGIRGFNLTMPNKNRIVELLDDLSPAAKLIGAVNTVINDNGILTGHNTDGIGFMQSLRDKHYNVENQQLTLLGSGGAATAIAAQSALDGASTINIFARRTSRFWPRMQKLADDINKSAACKVFLFDQEDVSQLKRSLQTSSLLVNATSVGMHPNMADSLITDTSLFHPGLFVSDVIYEPRETKLLKLAREQGCQTCNGMYMLLHQGAEAFRLFTGHDMPVPIIREKYFS